MIIQQKQIQGLGVGGGVSVMSGASGLSAMSSVIPKNN